MDVLIPVALVGGLFIITLICGLFPAILIVIRKKTPQRVVQAKKTIQASTGFAAGVFLAISLLELLPVVKTKFENIRKKSGQTLFNNYPLAELSIMCGFFLVLILEQIGLFIKDRQAKRAKYSTLDTTEMHSLHSEDNNGFQIAKEHHETVERPQIPKSHTFADAMLCLVLSIHSVFEGLAIGLQTNKMVLWTIFAAILLHKGIMSFSLGIKMIKSRQPPCRIFLYIIGFSIMSPLGIIIGTVSQLMSESFTASTTEAVLLAISTGTFFYITFVDVLPQELDIPDNKWITLIFITGGSFIVAALTLVPSYYMSSESPAKATNATLLVIG